MREERRKYVQIWSHKAYRRKSPGAEEAVEFDRAQLVPYGSTVIDFGSGTGRGSHALSLLGYRPTAVDFVAAAHEHPEIPFVDACLWDLPKDLNARYGFCCDVMEHIPPLYVRQVLEGIARRVTGCWFRIAIVPDKFGPKLLGEPLHLTIKDAHWWASELRQAGFIASHWIVRGRGVVVFNAVSRRHEATLVS